MSLRRRPTLECFVLLLYVVQQILAELLCFLDHERIGAGNMEVHVLFAFTARGGFDVSGPAALDLNTAPSFRLDMLDVCATVSNNLSAQVETWDRLERDCYLLLGPFASAKLVTLDRRLLGVVAALKAALIDKLGEFLLHQLLDLGYCLVQAFLGRGRYVEVERRVRRRGHRLVGKVASASGDIGTSLIFNLDQAAEVSRCKSGCACASIFWVEPLVRR